MEGSKFRRKQSNGVREGRTTPAQAELPPHHANGGREGDRLAAHHAKGERDGGPGLDGAPFKPSQPGGYAFA
jgi:hypothetical protein